MNRLLPTLAITVLTGGLLLSNPISAQFVPSAKKAAHVHILKGPELESATENLTIIRWTSDNPGGSQEPEPERQIAHPAEPDPFLYGFPRSHRRPPAEDHLLLHGGFYGAQRQERRTYQPDKHLHDAIVEQTNALAHVAVGKLKTDVLPAGLSFGRTGRVAEGQTSQWSKISQGDRTASIDLLPQDSRRDRLKEDLALQFGCRA